MPPPYIGANKGLSRRRQRAALRRLHDLHVVAPLARVDALLALHVSVRLFVLSSAWRRSRRCRCLSIGVHPWAVRLSCAAPCWHCSVQTVTTPQLLRRQSHRLTLSPPSRLPLCCCSDPANLKAQAKADFRRHGAHAQQGVRATITPLVEEGKRGCSLRHRHLERAPATDAAVRTCRHRNSDRCRSLLCVFAERASRSPRCRTGGRPRRGSRPRALRCLSRS